MTEEVTGGLPTEEPVIKATQPKTGGLSIGANKGMSFNPAQSADIKARLLDMIAAREAQKQNIFTNFAESLTPYAGPVEYRAQNVQAQDTRNQQREQDILNMRLGIAQMDTEQERLAQAKAQKAKDDQMFFQLLGVPVQGAGTAPVQGAQGTNVVPAQGNMPSEPTAEIFALYRQDPKAALTKLIEMRKTGDIEKRLLAAGVKPGSEAWNAALFSNVAGSGAFVPHDVRGPGGTLQTTPFASATSALSNNAPAPTTARQPAPVATAPAPVTTTPAPVATAPAPVTTTPAPRVTPQAVTRPAPTQQVSDRTPPAGQPGSVIVSDAPTGFKPTSKENLEILVDRAKAANEELRAEAAATGKATAEELQAFKTATESAPTSSQISQEMQKDIRTSGSLLGKLSQGGALSAVMGFVDKGIAAGTIGTINVPGFKEAVVKLDPTARDPKVMDAYSRVARNLEQLKLDYSRKVFKGQGAVSDNERKLIASAVGDADYTSPSNLMKIAKANELEARNQMDQDRLWSQMNKAGYSWRKFKDSPELADMKRNQFYRTAKTFGITDAKYPGDQ